MKSLSEKDFIQNRRSLVNFPFLFLICLLAVSFSLIFSSSSWFEKFLQNEKKNSPFLEVTNRDFSLFLWQFPSFMRINFKKTGYLPGFSAMGVNFDSETDGDFVSAPPEILFLYHTWHRLLDGEFIPRKIDAKEFEAFLTQLPEWDPMYWKQAPADYRELIVSKKYLAVNQLEKVLPLSVQKAFIGWKNYFYEGEHINSLSPTFSEVKHFLEKHPHYARNEWRNIDEVEGQKIAGLTYLSSLDEGIENVDAPIPKEQMAPFLKVAIFNRLLSKLQSHATARPFPG